MAATQTTVSALIERANAIRRGTKVDPDEGFALAKQLAKARHLDTARRLAQHLADGEALAGPAALELLQKLALWTSQNPDAADDSKHDEALAILDRIARIAGGATLATTRDAETLGIAGGICKRKWLTSGEQRVLELSLAYYTRGAQAGIEVDNGYTAINQAFILDLLASDDLVSGAARRAQASAIRARILSELAALAGQPAWDGGPLRKDLRWYHETLAEAHFGLRDYAQAKTSLREAYAPARGEISAWELETTARQFAWLARLQDPATTTLVQFDQSAAWGVLRDIYGRVAQAAAGSLFAGKLGLALSGGGFRASLFHIGVLAALAERDLLRHVEVLSCVSGGSIVGAHYYLEIRKLLEDKTDEQLAADDYVKLVERVAHDFLAGVQDNLRTRIGADLWANLRMMFEPGYTTSSRLAELYEKHLYARIADDKQRVLRKLIIKPKGDEACNPQYDNWKREHKVPILILNATSLNTGHNWQFTASWMGEPPALIDSEIDGNYRLRRMYLEDEAPAPHRDIRIGQAAAASSCVPGMFAPLELRNLYQGDVTVRLVDGGVHDNQGIFGLLDQNCTVMLVSDASGQMNEVDDPPDDPIGVLLRTTSMLQARVRTAQYREVEARRKSGRLKEFMYLHLKKDLDREDRDWRGCQNPKQITNDELRARRGDLTSYGVFKPFQHLLAGIRTDLDSFHETEAHALMLDGYAMASSSLQVEIRGFASVPGSHAWRFQQPALQLDDASVTNTDALTRLLAVAGNAFFKIWALDVRLRMLAKVVGLIGGLALLVAVIHWRDAPLISPKGLVVAAGLGALGYALGKRGLGWLLKVTNLPKTAHQLLIGAGLCVFGWLATNAHLRWFDPRYLRAGKINRDD